MKTLLTVIFSFTILFLSAQIVNIPDINFKNTLLEHDPVIDTNGDGEIQVSEAESFTADMNLVNKNISNLVGIESFINLLVLECGTNSLESLDVSMLKSLSYLDCRNNELMSLFLPDCIGYLWCYGNNLTSLDVSNKIDLYELNCSSNDLIELNVYDCSALTQITCEGNDLTYIDLSNTPSLFALNATQCNIASIDVSNLPNLIELYLGENYLSEIDISNNLYLHGLGLSYNNLTELDVSNNPYLEMFWCNHNQISSLDLSSHEMLYNFRCSNNELEFLDLRTGHNIDIGSFGAENNPDLTCIYVDDAEWSNDNWTYIDDNSNFVETEAQCAEIMPVNDIVDETNTIYPNPFNNYLEVNSFEDKNIQIELFDILGNKVLTTTNRTIDTSIIPTAFYIIRITLEDGLIHTEKLFKE